MIKISNEIIDNELIVNQNSMGIIEDEDVILKTYGVSTCLGIAVICSNKRVLIHADATTSLFQVGEVIKEIVQNNHAQIMFLAGDHLMIDYSRLKERLLNSLDISITKFQSNVSDLNIKIDNNSVVVYEGNIDKETIFKLTPKHK